MLVIHTNMFSWKHNLDIKVTSFSIFIMASLIFVCNILLLLCWKMLLTFHKSLCFLLVVSLHIMTRKLCQILFYWKNKIILQVLFKQKNSLALLHFFFFGLFNKQHWDLKYHPFKNNLLLKDACHSFAWEMETSLKLLTLCTWICTHFLFLWWLPFNEHLLHTRDITQQLAHIISIYPHNIPYGCYIISLIL